MRFFKLHWRLCRPPAKHQMQFDCRGLCRQRMPTATGSHTRNLTLTFLYINVIIMVGIGSISRIVLFLWSWVTWVHWAALCWCPPPWMWENLADAEFIRFRMGANEWSRFEIWPTEWALLAPLAWNTTLALLSAFHLENTQLGIVCDYKTASTGAPRP